MMLVLLAAAASAVATAPLPAYDPGDAFVFSDGRVERVITNDGGSVEWGGVGDSRYRRDVNPIVPILAWRFNGGEGRRSVSRGAAALWPLAPGRSARFSVVTQISRGGKVRRSVALWSCEVGRPAQVRITAGVFDTLPIQCDRYSPNSMRLAERVVWQWSPDVGHYVQRTVTLYADGSTSHIDLVAALPGASATLARLAALSQRARVQDADARRPTASGAS